MGRPRKTNLDFVQENKKTGVSVPIDRALLEGFVKTFLWERFDNPKETPRFHGELWDLFCAPDPWVAVAAPRGHAKSTAGTFAFGLAAGLFGFRSFIVIVGATEELAVKQIQELKTELTENEDLIDTFQIKGFSKENESEFICHAGENAFKIIAKGAGQKLRGIKWRGKRPDLILVDDLEEDEAVLSQERRIKLSDWFMNALLPLGSDRCLIRVVGTILHFDSLLQNLLKSNYWKSRCYRAHKEFDDFSDILWPEQFPEEKLRRLRGSYVEKNNPSGYSQEYLNYPIATTDLYFRPEWFIPMDGPDFDQPMTYYAAIDLAISKADSANKTSITVGGLDPDNRLHIIHNEAGRWDSKEIIDKMFEIHNRFHPELFVVEKGQISHSLKPFLEEEMLREGIFLNLEYLTPSKDKPTRARSLQARMKAGSVKFDQEASWYGDLYNEMITFPRGQSDDRVDSTAYIGLILSKMVASETQEAIEEAEAEYEELMDRVFTGRNTTTGY